MSSLRFSQFDNKSNNNLKDIHDRYMNGRVMLSNKPVAPFELFQGERQETPKSYDRASLDSIMETTPVSQLFFSSDNKEYIHKRIIDDVYVKSEKKYNIGRQSDIHLLIIMRSIYFQYGRNLFCDISDQVKELNEMVIKDCVSRILVEATQRLKYNEFVSYLPEQIPLPKNYSMKGDKILYSKIG
jgi:hypothetical protein